VASAVPAVAQVVNGTFDVNVEGWEHSNSLELAWDPTDSASRPASGSLRIRNVTASDNGGFPSATQCVPVQGGVATTLSAQIQIPAAQLAPAQATVVLVFNSGVACESDSLVSTSAPSLMNTNGLWARTSLSLVAPSRARSALVYLGLRKPGGGLQVAEALFDDVELRVADGTCRPDFDTLCLNGDQFKATVRWRDYSDQQGVGRSLPLTGDSGLFWFFDGDNPELLVKVIDGCAINGRFWVYAAATTDVEYEFEVEHLESGTQRGYRNNLGQASDAITDTDAFATCPVAEAPAGLVEGGAR
jgi:hypothetical protein